LANWTRSAGACGVVALTMPYHHKLEEYLDAYINAAG
jgi:hypothetical protein